MGAELNRSQIKRDKRPWLDDAQFYSDPADAGLGERLATWLRELLRDPGRGPVLVLATVWAQILGYPDRPPGRRWGPARPRRGSCWPGTASPCPRRLPRRR